MAKNKLNISIQNFDGNPATVDFFFSQLKDLQDLNKYTEKETIALFKSKLTGPALHFYLDSNVIEQNESLDNLHTQFKNFFCPVQNKNIALSNLENLKYEANESIRNFSYRLIRTLNLAYPNINSDALATLKMTYLMKTLPQNIRIKLLEEGIQTFDLALKRAEELYAIYASASTPILPTPSQSVFALHTDTNELEDQKHNFDSKYDNSTRERSNFFLKKNCFPMTKKRFKGAHPYKFNNKQPNSSRYSSTMLNRPQLLNSNFPGQNRNFKFYSQRFSRDSFLQCVFCGKSGHLMNNCYQFKHVLHSQGQQNSPDSQSLSLINNGSQPQQAYPGRSNTFRHRNPRGRFLHSSRGRQTNSRFQENFSNHLVLNRNNPCSANTAIQDKSVSHLVVTDNSNSGRLNHPVQTEGYDQLCSKQTHTHFPSVERKQTTPIDNSTTPLSSTNDSQSHSIFSSFDMYSILPCIQVNIQSQLVAALIDTGSSLSLIDQKYLSSIKSTVKLKYLSRNVTISTINSKVIFSGCVQFSFKIGNIFCSHNFFVTDIGNNAFRIILGFDFIQQRGISIIPSFGSILFNDSHIPFIYQKSDSIALCLNTKTNCSEDIISDKQDDCIIQCEVVENNEIIQDDVFGQHEIRKEPCSELLSQVEMINKKQRNHCKHNSHTNIEENKNKATVFVKSEIPPQTTTYVKIQVPSSFHKGIFIFNPKESLKQLQFQPSIHCIEHISNKDVYVVVENTSNDNVCLNKNMYVGYLHEISPNDILDNTYEDYQQFCGVITPSSEILQQRIGDLLPQDFKLDHLPDNEKEHLQDLLMKNATAFSKNLRTLGHTDLVQPHLQFLNKNPIKSLPFPVPQALESEALQQLQEMQEANIIHRSNSAWACPMLLVKKKQTDPTKPQTYRLALDLRLLNAIILPSTYPLPKIQNLLLNLSRYKFFTTLDLPSAYWQIAVPKDLQEKLSFTTPWGVFTYHRLVFGLRTAASTFQELIDSIIQIAGIEGCYAYQDDIVIGANNFQEMFKKIQTILEVMKKYNITLSPAKCNFMQTEIQFLGFHLSNHQVSPISSNITKIVNFTRPKTKRQLKGFIGLCSFYRNLVPKFADLVSPLIHLTKPKTPFLWTEQHQDAFDLLQRIFFQKPILNLPDWTKTFYVNTDASKTAIAAVLMQKINDRLMPISYFSKLLSDTEKKYPAIKLELYAIYKSLIAFKYYIFNREFVLLSDAQPLKKYKKSSSPADITTRWLLEISEYSFSFQHIPGDQNLFADYLSRMPPPEIIDISTAPELLLSEESLPISSSCNDLHKYLMEQQDSLQKSQLLSSKFHQNKERQKDQQINCLQQCDPLLEISDETIRKEQRKDPKLMKIIEELQLKPIPKHIKNYYLLSPLELLCFSANYSPDIIHSHRVVLPSTLIPKALTIAHITHTGVRKTLQNITKRYTWKNMYADVLNFVKSCELCVKYKNHKHNKAPLMAAPIPTAPNQKVSLDIVGPIKGHFYVLTIIDHFSRHLELYSLSSLHAKSVTNALLLYIATHGRPHYLLSDQGSQFTAHMFSIFNKALGIKLKHISVAHPEANGISERINSQIKTALHTMSSQGFPLETALKIHQSVYNSTTHPSTGFSPNLLHFGRELSDIYENYKSHAEWNILDTSQDIYQLIKMLDTLHFQALHNTENLRQQVYKKSEGNRKLPSFKINDKVYMKYPNVFKKEPSGPYVVQKIISPVILQLQLQQDPHASPVLVHTNRLLHLHDRQTHLSSQIPDPAQALDHNSYIDHPPNSSSIPQRPPRYYFRSHRPQFHPYQHQV